MAQIWVEHKSGTGMGARVALKYAPHDEGTEDIGATYYDREWILILRIEWDKG